MISSWFPPTDKVAVTDWNFVPSLSGLYTCSIHYDSANSISLNLSARGYLRVCLSFGMVARGIYGRRKGCDRARARAKIGNTSSSLDQKPFRY